jgi:hypothetical protein
MREGRRTEGRKGEEEMEEKRTEGRKERKKERNN